MDDNRGMKFDAGKLLAGILIQDFPRAQKAVAEIATFGVNKYARSSWQTVPDAMTRYTDAKFRHILEGEITPYDEESGLLHKAHEAWNALATLELYLIEQEKAKAMPRTTQPMTSVADIPWVKEALNRNKESNETGTYY